MCTSKFIHSAQDSLIFVHKVFSLFNNSFDLKLDLALAQSIVSFFFWQLCAAITKLTILNNRNKHKRDTKNGALNFAFHFFLLFFFMLQKFNGLNIFNTWVFFFSFVRTFSASRNTILVIALEMARFFFYAKLLRTFESSAYQMPRIKRFKLFVSISIELFNMLEPFIIEQSG